MESFDYQFIAKWDILILNLMFALFLPYLGDLLPGYETHPRMIVLIADFILLITLVILGGEFFDKLRSLFSYDAKVVFPKKK